MKLKGRHFETTEVTEAESQVVLNTLTNTTSRYHLKHGRRAGKGKYARKGIISRAMVASRPKVSFFDKTAEPVPDIIDGSFYRYEVVSGCLTLVKTWFRGGFSPGNSSSIICFIFINHSIIDATRM
jgi:hypothetical protein